MPARKSDPLHCAGCDKVKTPDDFYTRPGYRCYPCKDCRRARVAMKKYSITRERYAELRSRGTCDLCGTAALNRAGYAMHIDHDHATGEVRGVLCQHCNVMIGMAREDPEILRRAIDWIGRVADATA